MSKQSIKCRPSHKYRTTELHAEIADILRDQGKYFINIYGDEPDEKVVQLCADDIIDVILNRRNDVRQKH